MLVDSHCHLDRIDLTPFGGSLSNAIERAALAGVGELLCVAINQENQQAVLQLATDYPQVYASVGIHPLNTEGQSADVEYLSQTAKHPKVIAIGETGLDYYYAESTKKEQLELFHTHVQAAVKVGKPLIVHTRDAQKDTIDVLTEEGAEKVGGVLHCFTESFDMATKAISMGFYISFSGILTFRNADSLREVAKKLPLERLLVETDSPYLTPVPHRGKPNSPQYVVDVARCLADIRGISFDEVAKATTNNYRRLFSRTDV